MRLFTTTDKKTLLAVGAAVVLVPVLAYTLGFVSGRDNPTGFVDSAAATVPQPAPPAPEPPFEPARYMPAIPETPEPIVQKVAVESGDNLMGVLMRAGADRHDAHTAIQTLSDLYDPRRDLRVGDELQITLGPVPVPDGEGDASEGEDHDFVLAALTLPVSYDREVAVDRDESGAFSAREVMLPLESEMVRVSGTIDSSLFLNGRAAGIPNGVLVEMIRIFSFDVDFQRDIWSGDSFELLYERLKNQDGVVVHNGEVQYARLILRGESFPLYRYETSKGDLDYFNEKGESVRKALMKTPIDGARLSSNFGKRKHPILGFTKMHTGTDFAAPSGTPIYAAGDGTVVEAGVKGGYGNYIRLRHNGTYQTAYAHMKGFARGVRSGARVRQGQVIGYVGTTGRSTGPHLHYEVLRDSAHINPMTLKLPSGETLKGQELAAFQASRAALDAAYAALDPETRLANAATGRFCAGEGADC